MKQLFMFLMFATILNCNSQTRGRIQKVNYTIKLEKKMKPKNSITQKENLTKPFNIVEFEKNKGKYYDGDPYESQQDYTYKLEDETIVSQSFFPSFCLETRRKENFPINVYYEYYANGSFKKKVTKFNKSSIGIINVFNKQGDLITEINNDLPFKLSFEDIRKIIFKTKGIDVYDTNQAIALRHTGDKDIKPYYQIHVLKELTNGLLRPDYSFLLDAETGKEFNPQKKAIEENAYIKYKGKEYTRKEWLEYMKTDQYKKENPNIWNSLFGKKTK